MSKELEEEFRKDLEELATRIQKEKQHYWTMPNPYVVDHVGKLMSKYSNSYERRRIIGQAIYSYMQLPLQVWHEQDGIRRSME
jgi:hypothetical protein